MYIVFTARKPGYLSFAFSWLAKANLAAFSWSLANLFSYLDTFLRDGLMLKECTGMVNKVLGCVNSPLLP